MASADLSAWLLIHPREPVVEVSSKDLDPYVVALLEERSRSRGPEHTDAINFELAQRGYVEEKPPTPEAKPEEKRAEAAQGNKATPPDHGPARNKPQYRR